LLKKVQVHIQISFFSNEKYQRTLNPLRAHNTKVCTKPSDRPSMSVLCYSFCASCKFYVYDTSRKGFLHLLLIFLLTKLG